MIKSSKDPNVHKQNVAYPYNEILFGHKKEWSTNTCNNLVGPWKHYVKGKRPVIQDHKLYGSIWWKSKTGKCIESGMVWMAGQSENS